MHPASPLLKGGFAGVAVVGVLLANFRERLVRNVFPDYGEPADPIDMLLTDGRLFIAVGIIFGVILLAVLWFALSWRMHSFRVTGEVVEVRSGILFRTNRKARLDRIQGINIERPLLARIFGVAKLEVSQAGQDANVQLAYLSSAAADELRAEVLMLASGARAAHTPAADSDAAAHDSGATLLDRRVSEFLAPELDPKLVAAESVVTIHPGRLVGSILLSDSTIFMVLAAAAMTTVVVMTGELFALFALLPAAIGFVSFYANRITKSLRYSIASTPDGVRVGFGLLSTTNETLPPGRIHSVQVSQPLLWRLTGWWEVRVNRASHSSTSGAAGQANTTILPVGDREDVLRVLALLLPTLDDPHTRHLMATGLDAGRRAAPDGYTTSPRRAAYLRWFSWRRNGFAVTPQGTLLRRGAIWRSLTIVPAARAQSVSVSQGPLYRMSRLAKVAVHTVAGPISPRLGAMDADDALTFFRTVAELTVSSSTSDTSHRWRRDGEALPADPPHEPGAEPAP